MYSNGESREEFLSVMLIHRFATWKKIITSVFGYYEYEYMLSSTTDTDVQPHMYSESSDAHGPHKMSLDICVPIIFYLFLAIIMCDIHAVCLFVETHGQ